MLAIDDKNCTVATNNVLHILFAEKTGEEEAGETGPEGTGDNGMDVDVGGGGGCGWWVWVVEGDGYR